MDLPTIAVAVGGYFGLKDLVPRILDPTADYLGGELKKYTEKGIINLRRIFSNAGKKLGKELEKPGTVPPKVLKGILYEGYFCEDELTSEYLGGVLASSRSENARDDRGTAFLTLLGSMSSYQIRTHYIAYTSILFADEFFEMKLEWAFSKDYWTVLLGEPDYVRCMSFSNSENQDDIAYHSFLGLDARGLCSGGMEIIPARENIRKDITVPFRFFHPTRYGVELYMWGIGLGSHGIQGFFDKEIISDVKPLFNVRALMIKHGKVFYS